MKLIIFFFCVFSIISCSAPNGNVRLSYTILMNDPISYENFAGKCISNLISEEPAPTGNVSIFPTSVIRAISISLGNSSENEEYANLMRALDRFLKRYASEIIGMVGRGSLERSEGQLFIEAMKYVAKEDAHFAKYSLENFEYSPETLELIFTALQTIDPSAVETLELIAEFVKYIIIDSQMEKFLAVIMIALEDPSRNIPFIKFHPNFPEKTRFDSLISELHSRYSHSPENLVTLAKNIIYGPITDSTTDLFYSIINLHPIIEQLCRETTDLDKLVIYVFRSKSYHRIATFISMNPSDSTIMINIKAQLKKQHDNLEAIELFLRYNHFFSANETDFNLIMDYFDSRSYALGEYYRIDKPFVENGVIYIDEKIGKLLEHSGKLSRKTTFNGLIILIMMYYKGLPVIPLENDLTIHFEKFLSLMMHPSADLLNILLLFTKAIKRAIVLPYIKIDRFLLQKIYHVYLKASGLAEAAHMMDSVSIFYIFSRSVGDKFLNFIEVHKFSELEGLDMSAVASSVILAAYFDVDHVLIEKLISYSITNRLISKSFVLVTEILLNHLSKIRMVEKLQI